MASDHDNNHDEHEHDDTTTLDLAAANYPYDHDNDRYEQFGFGDLRQRVEMLAKDVKELRRSNTDMAADLIRQRYKHQREMDRLRDRYDGELKRIMDMVHVLNIRVQRQSSSPHAHLLGAATATAASSGSGQQQQQWFAAASDDDNPSESGDDEQYAYDDEKENHMGVRAGASPRLPYPTAGTSISTPSPAVAFAADDQPSAIAANTVTAKSVSMVSSSSSSPTPSSSTASPVPSSSSTSSRNSGILHQWTSVGHGYGDDTHDDTTDDAYHHTPSTPLRHIHVTNERRTASFTVRPNGADKLICSPGSSSATSSVMHKPVGECQVQYYGVEAATTDNGGMVGWKYRWSCCGGSSAQPGHHSPHPAADQCPIISSGR